MKKILLSLTIAMLPYGVYASETRTVTLANVEAVTTHLVALRDSCDAKDSNACVELASACHVVDNQENDTFMRRFGFQFLSAPEWRHLRSTLTKCRRGRYELRQ